MDLTGPSATPEAMLPGSRTNMNHIPSPPASDLSANKRVRLSFSVDAIMSSDRYNKSDKIERTSPTSRNSSPLGVTSPRDEDHYHSLSYRRSSFSPERRCDSRGSSEEDDADIDPVSDEDGESSLTPHNDSFGSSDRSSPVSPQDHPHHPLPQHHPSFAVQEFLSKSGSFPNGVPSRGGPGMPGSVGAHPFLVSPDTGARWHPAASPADLSWFSAAAANMPPPIPSKFQRKYILFINIDPYRYNRLSNEVIILYIIIAIITIWLMSSCEISINN